SYSPADGQADPPRTTRAFATAAQRLGATYWTRTTCLSLLTDGNRITGLRTERGDVAAETVVLASGAWSDTLAAEIGLRLPIRTRALQMVLTTPAAPGQLRPVIGALSRPLSLKQLDDGAFFLGGGWLGDPTPDRRGYTLRQSNVEGNFQTARELLPAVGAQQIARAWCGLEAESFDEIPFIGWAPDRAHLYLALGFSGHGFAISPAVGHAVADDLSGQFVPELSGLRPDRIAQFDTAAIAAFISQESTNAPAG
ncbi:MAG: NAD(P)/FAD-dependent oxidoreductase, partial [Ktedonobacterales bacterium]